MKAKDYTIEYCPFCEQEVAIRNHSITACPECGKPLVSCSVCLDEKIGCYADLRSCDYESCPYGCTGGTEDKFKPITNPPMTEEEIAFAEANMIKNYNPIPFERPNPLPTYVVITERYELLAKTNFGYVIKLAKLTIGKSMSADNPLSLVLFESFSEHGEQMAVARTLVNGYGRVFSTVINAMMEVEIEFQASNPDIEHCKIVSQSCH